MILTLLSFIAVFGILVFAHEMGHFIAARLNGVTVKEFAFGFPPRIFKKKVGETTYAINAIPVGGYVQLLGEQGEEEKNPKSLTSKKAWQKAVIFASGVFANFVLAWFVLTLFLGFGGRAIIPGIWEHKEVQNTQRAKITEVAKGSFAEKEGVPVAATITKVNGNNVYSSEMVFTEIQASGEKVDFEYELEDQIFEKTISKYKEKVKADGQEIEVERIGIVMENVGEVKAPWHLAPIAAAKETYRISKMTVVEFGKFVSLAFKTGKISENVGGPVAIVKVTGAAAQIGFGALVQLLIILSISLGVINIMPFPALDGGHIVITGIEKVMGREVPKKVKETVNKVGFGLLLLLIVWITVKDLGRFGIINF